MNEKHLGEMILSQVKKYRGRNALFHKVEKNWAGNSVKPVQFY